MEDAQKNILVINKIITLRKLTVQALQNLGYLNIYEVENVDEAKKIISDIKDNLLVILELLFFKIKPEERAFIKHLQSMKGANNIPVIVTSQVANKGLVLKLLKIGIKGLVIKVYDIEILSKNLGKVISGTDFPIENKNVFESIAD